MPDWETVLRRMNSSFADNAMLGEVWGRAMRLFFEEDERLEDAFIKALTAYDKDRV